MGRAPCCEKVGLKRGRWTAEEDELLTKYIQANGEGSWRSLPKNAGLLRCGKSCRLRWINYLRGDLKRGNISDEEESLIVKLHASFGNRWSLIASHMPGRTDNEIKNYWNSHLSRKLVYTFRGSTTKSIVDTPPKRRRCGRTSRWAMKKNKTYSLINNDLQNQNNELEKEDPVARCDVKGSDDILCQEAINVDDDVLSFHEFMDTCLMEPSGDHNVDEERESAVMNDGGSEGVRDTCSTVDTVVTGRDSQSKSENHKLHNSCSSNSLGYSSGLDSVMEMNREDESSVLSREQNENLLTWLWEDEDWEKDFQIVDPEKHNDMLYWFLS